MRVVIFAGTTEGRKLSEMLSAGGIDHLVCVATQYGSNVMTKNPHAITHVGRMDTGAMREYFKANDLCPGDIAVDATHPYAAQVSQNISEAAESCGLKYLRVMRGRDGADSESYVNRYDSISEFATRIDRTEGNILLTTGSKELRKYCECVSDATLDRTFVRILPAIESISICDQCGIIKSHIIAMQGPFSIDMNAAIMRQYDIRHMLTKDSGNEGGFDEKIAAAESLGVTVHVLVRPEADEMSAGVSVYEAYKIITGSTFKPARRIVLAGAGTGGRDVMTLGCEEEIRKADAVFGAASVTGPAIKAVFGSRDKLICPQIFDEYNAEDIIETLTSEVNITNSVILFSGDSGFYSGAKKAYEKLREWDKDANISILPGVSSVSVLASKLCVSYDDAGLISIHGRNSLHNYNELVNAIVNNKKTFSLLSNDEDIRNVAGMLFDRGAACTVHIGRNLSMLPSDYSDGEELISLPVEKARNYRGQGRITALFINEKI